jgi:hypothetical protein
MEDLAFSFVENSLTRKYVALDPISRPTLMKYMASLGDIVEQQIKESHLDWWWMDRLVTRNIILPFLHPTPMQNQVL